MKVQFEVDLNNKVNVADAIYVLNKFVGDDKISQPEKISISEKPLENGVIKKEKKSKKAVEEEFDLKSNLETSSSDIPDAGSDLLPEPEEKKAPEKELSLDKDVKPAFAEYVKEHGAEGRQKAKKMLSENFGVENLPSLKAKDYKKALKLLSEL